MLTTLIPNHYPINKQGLVGWWSYRNSGNVSILGTCVDYSGSGNHGTLIGGAYIDKNGLHTPAIGDYLSTNINKDIKQSFTISTSCIKSSTGTRVLWSTGKGYLNNDIGIDFVVRDTFVQLRLNDGIGLFEEVIATYTMPQNIRTTFTVTIDFENARKIIYINGLVISNTALVKKGSVLNVLSTFDVGSAYSSWAGFIDDFMVLSRVLTANETYINYLRNRR